MIGQRDDERLVVGPPASVDEFHMSCAFITERYRQAGYLGDGQPFSCPKALLVARRGPRLVGAIGIESADVAPLPTERAFGFRCDEVLGVARERVFEGSRFAVAPRADFVTGQALVAASMLYAIQRHDCRYWLFTVTGPHEAFLRRGCHLRTTRLSYAVSDLALLRDYPAYWAVDPAPYPAFVDRASTDAALARLLPDFDGRVLLDLGHFDHLRDQSREGVIE